MTINRLVDYIFHIEQAAKEACSYVEGLEKIDFIADKRVIIPQNKSTLK